MLGEDNNILDYFGLYVNEKSVLEGSDIEKNDIDLVDESLDIESYTRNILSEYTS